MEPIRIIDKNGTTIAEHATDYPQSIYDTPVWTIYDDDPKPGPAVLFAENISCPIEIVGLKHSWLIIRRSDRRLSGTIWE